MLFGMIYTYIHIIIILYIIPFTDILSIMGIETSNQMRLNHFEVLINAINTWHIDIQQENLDKMVKISGLIREHWWYHLYWRMDLAHRVYSLGYIYISNWIKSIVNDPVCHSVQTSYSECFHEYIISVVVSWFSPDFLMHIDMQFIHTGVLFMIGITYQHVEDPPTLGTK